MEVLQDYMNSQQVAVNLAYGGEIGLAESSTIMAAVGIKGATRIKFFNIETDWHTFMCNMYFDIGAITTIDKTTRNDTTVLLQTRTRLYLVSEHYVDGTPLGMEEVRIVKTITPGCLLLVHTALHSYRVITGGNITCYRYGVGKRNYVLKAGNTLHLEGRDTCSNECLEIGFRGYNTMHKELAAQPSVHPVKLSHFMQDMEDDELPSPQKPLDKVHQVMHDIMAGDIRENEDLLLELSEKKHEKWISYSGIVGAALSILLTVVFLALCLRCQKQRKSNSSHITNDNSNDAVISYRSLLSSGEGVEVTDHPDHPAS